jgi:hypothetical protein
MLPEHLPGGGGGGAVQFRVVPVAVQVQPALELMEVKIEKVTPRC